MDTAHLPTLCTAIAPYEKRLLPDAGDPSLVRAADLLAGPFLGATLVRLMERLETTNLRAAASLWHKHYNAALLMAPLAAMTQAGVGLDARAEHALIAFGEDGLPKALALADVANTVVCRERLTAAAPIPGPAVGVEALREHVLQGLFPGHLTRIVDRLHKMSGLPKSVLWGNVGNLVADMYDKATGPAAAADRAVLLETAQGPWWPDGQNPLCRTVRYEDLSAVGLGEAFRVRETCCQRHGLKGYKHCYTCPLLKTGERVALMAELGLVK